MPADESNLDADSEVWEWRMTLIPPKVCPECGEPYTPMPRYDGTAQVTCGKKRCKFGRLSRQRRGQAPLAAIAAVRRKARARAEARVVSTFGSLSDREFAIFEYARKVGYLDGYNKAYHKAYPRKTA